jgi:hypothetical protein
VVGTEVLTLVVVDDDGVSNSDDITIIVHELLDSEIKK